MGQLGVFAGLKGVGSQDVWHDGGDFAARFIAPHQFSHPRLRTPEEIAAAFQAPLNPHTGFEIIRAECGLPALIVPMVRDVGTRDVHRNPASLGGSVLARKISAPRADLRWDLTAAEVAAGEYPRERA